MRVALVHPEFNLGGSLGRERVLLARSLAALGLEVHAYADPEGGIAEIPGVTVHEVVAARHGTGRLTQPLATLAFARAATKRLRAERSRFDVVDVAGAGGWELDVVRFHAVMAAEQRRWPERGGRTYHLARARAALAPALRPQVGVVRAIERRQLRPGRYLRVAAVTDEVRDDLVAFHGVPPDRVEVVSLPVETERFAAAAGGRVRERLGIDGELLLAFVGHDFERKGLEEAVASLAGLEPPAHLAVLGRGPRARYEQAARQAGVADRVHFLGASDAPEDVLADADALFAPTREDVWGMVLVEAMAAGVPVVTTAVAGAAGEVASAGAGIVVERAEPASLRAALGRVLENADGRREMGERGRRAAARFGLEPYGRRMLGVYEQALAERK